MYRLLHRITTVITYLRCWENTKKVCKSRARGRLSLKRIAFLCFPKSSFTFFSSSSSLPNLKGKTNKLDMKRDRERRCELVKLLLFNSVEFSEKKFATYSNRARTRLFNLIDLANKEFHNRWAFPLRSCDCEIMYFLRLMKIDKRFAWMRPGDDRSEKNSTKKKQLNKKWWK